MTVEFEGVAVQLGRVFRVISGRVADAAYIMIGAPIGHQARIALGHQFRTDRMERHACRFGFRADVVKERGVIQRRILAIALLEYFGNRGCPGLLHAVEPDVVVKDTLDGIAHVFAVAFAVFVVIHPDELADGRRVHVVDLRADVVPAAEKHDPPGAGRHLPRYFSVTDMVPEIDHLVRVDVHRRGSHQQFFRAVGQDLREGRGAGNDIFVLLEELARVARILGLQSSAGCTAREIDVVVNDQFHAVAVHRFDHIVVSLEIGVGQVLGPCTRDRQHGNASESGFAFGPVDLLDDRVARERAVQVPERHRPVFVGRAAKGGRVFVSGFRCGSQQQDQGEKREQTFHGRG